MGVAKSILGEAVQNIKTVGRSGSYFQAAAKGAAVMGTVGGVSEWAQGGSFVAGAKSNLVSGAALGVAGRAANIGVNAGAYDNSSLGSTYSKMSDRIGGQRSSLVSKPVKTIQKANVNTNTAKKVMNKVPADWK